MNAKSNSYTVFCIFDDGRGPIQICSVEAESVQAAKQAAILRCAEDWKCWADRVHVLGVAAGAVAVLEWTDVAARET